MHILFLLKTLYTANYSPCAAFKKTSHMIICTLLQIKIFSLKKEKHTGVIKTADILKADKLMQEFPVSPIPQRLIAALPEAKIKE